ncbi:alpha/beta fold hydrolase [Actinomyces urinae]|uniref:alpha/beta fold hydrolase n=1 Tax=Actinomyces urinae TaxID=1689268 RepID=UPI0009300765|nr:alpha/beta fold hydrolase [Actinomyces urinae]
MNDYTVTNSLVSIGDGIHMRVHRFRRDFIDEGAPTFVLVHGIGVSSEYFVPVAEILVEHGDVITLDLPGFGDTTRPPHPLSIAGFAAAAHKIMRFEDVKNPVMLGHSMGAQVVTEMATRDPEWIKRILLIGPPINALERTFIQAGLRFAQSSIFEPFEVSRFAVGAYLRSGLAWFMETLPQMVAYPIGLRLADTRARTYLMRGQHDAVAPRAWLEDLRLAAVSCTGVDAQIFEVEDGAHSVIVAHADEVARALIALSQEAPIEIPATTQAGVTAGQEQVKHLAEAAASPSRTVESERGVWEQLSEHSVAPPPLWAAVPIALTDYARSGVQSVRAALIRSGLAGKPAEALRLEGAPVCIGIPGIVETTEHLHIAGHALRGAGWDVHFVPALNHLNGPIPLFARRLEKYLVDQDLQDVVLFAHSKGGLIGKTAMTGPQGWRIRAMVTLGTPYAGSPLANYAPKLLRVADLRTDDLNLRTQYEDIRVNPRITSIQARWDQQVPTGSWLPGARVVTANIYGHNNLLTSPEALRVLVAEMERRKPRA